MRSTQRDDDSDLECTRRSWMVASCLICLRGRHNRKVVPTLCRSGLGETCLSSYHHIVFKLKTTEDTHNSQLAIMSLPRSDYDPRRVCLNPFPNFTLGKHKRTMGIYLAGGLVCLSNSQVSNAMVYLYVRLLRLLGCFIVCFGELDIP